MMGNDLSNSPTPRYWVLSEAVFTTHEVKTEKKRFFRPSVVTEVLTVPDRAVLSKLWRWSSTSGVRVELVFVGRDATSAPELWDVLEKEASNPFNDWLAMENYSEILSAIPYRPDLLGVVDIPKRSALYGGRGLTVADLP